jgi:hypothetical protein
MQVRTMTPQAACAGLAFAGLLLIAGCRSLPQADAGAPPEWAGPGDCFAREVSVPAAQAALMARLCGGETGAGDPARSGIDRANAFFNAGAAHNRLAATASPGAPCETPAACHETALKLIERSLLSQEDAQLLAGGAGVQAARDNRFRFRRRLEQARALRALAASEPPASACPEPQACLEAAAARLELPGLDAAQEGEDRRLARLACEAMDLRWRVSHEIGREREFSYLRDLSRIIAACPEEAAGAADKLAAIAFEQAEAGRVRLVMPAPGAGAGERIDTAFSALSSYRRALAAERFRLPSHRGIGELYEVLAGLEPGNATPHLTNAAEAFQAALAAPGAGLDAGQAKDLGRLGVILHRLAGLTESADPDEAARLRRQAIRALEEAAAIAPEAGLLISLGTALGAAGEGQRAATVYAAALAADAGRVEAGLGLAAILEGMGEDAEALHILEELAASSAQPDTAILYQIGRLRFARGDVAEALARLAPVATTLAPAEAAEAAYMLSIAEVTLRRIGWQQRAADHAGRALAGGGDGVRYRRQACLAAILSAGAARRSAADLERCQAGGSAEGALLRAMAFLKQAQLAEVSAYDLASQERWRSILRLAEEALLAGLGEIPDLPASARSVRFDDLRRQIDLEAELARGLDVVRRCRREISIAPGTPAWRELEAFYGHYGVLTCSRAR